MFCHKKKTIFEIYKTTLNFILLQILNSINKKILIEKYKPKKKPITNHSCIKVLFVTYSLFF